MKRVLYISYDGITDPLGQSQILPYLTRLAANNYEVHILSFEKKNAFSKQKEIVSKIVNENNITWHYHFFTSSPRYISKFYDLFRLKRKSQELHKQFQYDAVHCRSYIAAQAGLLLKKMHGVKFIFDMRGFWIDERIENGQWNPSSFLFSLLIKRYRKMEKDFFEHADVIVSLTEKAKKHLVDHTGIDERKIVVIPCCADLELFDYKNHRESRKEELKQELGLKDGDYVAVYSGSLGALYLIEETIQVFKKIKEEIRSSKLLILSKISKEQLKPFLERNDIDEKAILIRWSNRVDMPVYLGLSKVALCFINASFSKIASSPTKLAEYLAMGLPVIVNAGIGDDDEIIKGSGSGAVLNSFTETEINRAIAAVQNITLPSLNSVNCAEKYYDLRVGINKYLAIYDSIL
jgi:glycosyltransferase involved in cell wall biosynthesis